MDFSTGSVGIGATATIWSSLAHRYVASRFNVPAGGRQVALVGDAELDEGAVWEALNDPMVSQLSELMWVVDVNRQSLDRVVPDIAAGRIGRMFEAVGWQTISIKYGHRLREVFARPGGDALQHRLDAMSNEEFQRLLRTPTSELRDRFPGQGPESKAIKRILSEMDDAEIGGVIRDLGGHDLLDLEEAFCKADANTSSPSVIFAYTIKAWNLPTEGHPANHSALLSEEQWRLLARELKAEPTDPWARFREGTPENLWCQRAANRLEQMIPQRQVSAQGAARPRTISRVRRVHAAGLRAFLRGRRS